MARGSGDRGLDHPWSVAWLPDGSALVTERAGRLRLIRDGKLDPEPIAGLPPVLALAKADCWMSHCIRISPTTTSSICPSPPAPREANRTALARGRFDGHALRDTEVIFRNADLSPVTSTSAPASSGCRTNPAAERQRWRQPPLSFNGENIRNQAQNLGTHFGKVLRLKDDGTPAPDNPFVGQPGAKPEIWTLGHRNIQGMTRDPVSGRIWANEHGSRGGDELNVIRGGHNYGWPVVTYGIEYWGPKISDETSRPGITDPILVWTPSKAPSGLTFYTGEVYPGWKGDLFSGALSSARSAISN